MADIPKLLAGPAYIAATATNVYNQASALVYTIIDHIHIANITAGAVSANVCISTTGNASDGKNLMKGKSVPANDYIDLYPASLRLNSTDFLVALDGNGAALVITVSGRLSPV
jgi:hypothetical protein